MSNEQEELHSLQEQIKSEIATLEESQARVNAIGDLSEKLLDKLTENIAHYENNDAMLEDIQRKADQRKKDSEESVRTIKQQMSDMDAALESRFEKFSVEVVREMQRLSDSNDRNMMHVAETVSHRLRMLEHRMSEQEQWRFYFTLGVIVLIMILSLPGVIIAL